MPAKKKQTNLVAVPSGKKTNKNKKRSKDSKEVAKFFKQKVKQYNKSLDQDNFQSEVEEANELVMEAFSATPAKGQKLVRQALSKNPNCSAAYGYLGEQESSLELAVTYFEIAMGIEIEELGGDEFFQENAGYFWGLFETRTYMRLAHSYANKLLEFNNVIDAYKLFAHMLVLNPNDNQGIRMEIEGLLLKMKDLEDYDEVMKMISDYGLQ